MNTRLSSTIFITLAFILGMQLIFAEIAPVSSARFPVFSKNNNQLIYLNRKNEIVKLNTQTGQLVKKVPLNHYAVRPFAATPDGFKLLAASPVGIEVIHNGTGKILRTLPYPPKARQAISNSVQNHSGVLLAIPIYNPLFKQYDLIHTGSGKLLHTIDVTRFYPKGQRIDAEGIGFSEDRHTVAFAIRSNGKNTLHLYDLFKKKELARIELPNVDIYGYGGDALQFSKNGKKLLIQVVNRKGYILVDLVTHSAQYLASDAYQFIGFTPDDQSLISIHQHSHNIILTNIQTGKTRKLPFKLKQQSFHAVQSIDRSLIALATDTFSSQDHFELIDANTGKVLRQLTIQ